MDNIHKIDKIKEQLVKELCDQSENECNLKWEYFPKSLWKDFEEIMKNRFQDKFSDVTLAGDDGSVFHAHKFVLGSLSPVFRNLLLEEKEEEVYLHLDGLNSTEIESMLEFLYIGQTSVRRKDFEKFVEVASNLKLPFEKTNLLDPKLQVLEEPYYETACVEESVLRVTGKDEKLIRYDLNSSIECKEESQFSQHPVKDKNPLMKIANFECNDCNYSSKKKQNLNIHINAVHKGIKHPCNQCGKLYAQKSSLNLHIRSIHESVHFPCDFCSYKATTKGNLDKHTIQLHKQEIHELDFSIQ